MKTRLRAFTLIEMLVAVAVLAMVAVLIVNMMGGVSAAWNRSREKMDNFGKGRALLNLLQKELQNAVLREDLPVFPGGDFAFYTRSMSQDSVSTDPARPLTFVEYVKADDVAGRSVLKRVDQPYFYQKQNGQADPPAWTVSAVNADPPTNAPLSRQLCEGVYAFRHAFLDANGAVMTTFDKTSATPPKAVQVSMMVLSEQAEEALESSSLRAALETLLNDLPTPAGKQGWSPKAIWDAKLLQAGFPPRLLTGIRTFERVIPISYKAYGLPGPAPST